MTKVVTPTLVESPHPYGGNLDQTWVIDTGGDRSQVHFQYLDVENWYDGVEIRDVPAHDGGDQTIFGREVARGRSLAKACTFSDVGDRGWQRNR